MLSFDQHVGGPCAREHERWIVVEWRPRPCLVRGSPSPSARAVVSASTSRFLAPVESEIENRSQASEVNRRLGFDFWRQWTSEIENRSQANEVNQRSSGTASDVRKRYYPKDGAQRTCSNLLPRGPAREQLASAISVPEIDSVSGPKLSTQFLCSFCPQKSTQFLVRN